MFRHNRKHAINAMSSAKLGADKPWKKPSIVCYVNDETSYQVKMFWQQYFRYIKCKSLLQMNK